MAIRMLDLKLMTYIINWLTSFSHNRLTGFEMRNYMNPKLNNVYTSLTSV